MYLNSIFFTFVSAYCVFVSSLPLAENDEVPTTVAALKESLQNTTVNSENKITNTESIETTIATTSSTTLSSTTSTTSKDAADVTSTAATTVTTSSDSEPKRKYLTAENVPTCNQTDGKLGDCIKTAINILIPKFKTGDKDFNIVPFEPFLLNRTTFQYSNGPISGRLTMKNGRVNGFSNATMKAVDMKVKDDKIKVLSLAVLPVMTILGNYKADMKFNNNLRIRPRGTFNITLVGVSIPMKAEGVLYNADGHRFVRLNKFDAEPKIRDIKVRIDGLFSEPELNELASNVASQYWHQVYQVMLPETRRYWGPLLLGLLNQAFSMIPFDNFVRA